MLRLELSREQVSRLLIDRSDRSTESAREEATELEKGIGKIAEAQQSKQAIGLQDVLQRIIRAQQRQSASLRPKPWIPTGE
jgi:hypothetical protein